MVTTLPLNRTGAQRFAAGRIARVRREPATRHDEPKLFRQHAQEAHDESIRRKAEKPEGQRRAVTMEWAMKFVEKQFRTWDLRASGMPPCGFVETVDDLSAIGKP